MDYYRNEVEPSETIRSGLQDPAHFVSLEQLRNEVGLFDDDSDDDLLEEYLLTAVEMVEDIIGFALPGRTTTDRFRNPSYRMRLSSKAVLATTDVTVSARLQGSGETLTAITTGWYLDASTTPPIVVFDEAPNVDYRYTNPIEISYSAGIGDDYAVGREQFRQAVRYIVSCLYESKGTSGLKDGWQRGLASIIGLAHRAAV